MSIGIFTDKSQRPTDAEVKAAMGGRLALWNQLVDDVRREYHVEEDFRFLYGKKYGWALRFRIRRQLLTSLYPGQDLFTAQINLGPDAVERALSMELGENARLAIARAHPYPEGRWLFIAVESESDLRDVERLLALRVESKRL